MSVALSKRALQTEDSDARTALRWLRDSPIKRHPCGVAKDANIEQIVRETLEVRDRVRALADEHDRLKSWIAEMTPWGDFALPKWDAESPLRLWFYEVPLRKVEHLAATDVPWKIVGKDRRFAYVVAVAATAPPRLPVPPLKLEPRSLSQLRKRLRDVEREVEELEHRRIGLGVYIDLLCSRLGEADDRVAKRSPRGGYAAWAQTGVAR
jgi:V/A-type H+-transporting ATPase subunit I